MKKKELLHEWSLLMHCIYGIIMQCKEVSYEKVFGPFHPSSPGFCLWQ